MSPVAAAGMLEKAPSLVETSAQEHYERAMALTQTGHTEAYDQAAHHKRSTGWHAARGAVGVQRCAGTLEKAVNELNRAILLDPACVKASP